MLTFDQANISRQNDVMRKPRYKRVKAASALRPRESIFEVLALLYQFKALRSSHIEMHLPKRHGRGLRHSLRNLFDHGLVDKVGGEHNLYQHDVYTLTRKGYEMLALHDLPHRFVTNRGELGMAFYTEFDHSMMVIDLLSNLKAGADRCGVRMISCEEIAGQTDDPRPFEFPASYVYETTELRRKISTSAKPDGFVGFEYPNGKKAYFAIEAERQNPVSPDTDIRAATRSSAKKKFLSYRHVVKTGVFKKLGIGNMRVLVVAPTPTKIRNKFAVGGELVGQSHLFLGHWLPVSDGTSPPLMPHLFGAPWLRIGLPPEHIDGTVAQAREIAALPDPN